METTNPAQVLQNALEHFQAFNVAIYKTHKRSVHAEIVEGLKASIAFLASGEVDWTGRQRQDLQKLESAVSVWFCEKKAEEIARDIFVATDSIRGYVPRYENEDFEEARLEPSRLLGDPHA